LLDGLTDEDETTDETTEDETTDVVVSGDDMLTVELSPETPMASFVAADRERTEILAFDVTAGSQDVSLKQATLEYVGLSDSDDLTVLSMYLGNKKATKSSSKRFDDE
ncbi:MAG: hypothetical protein P1U46_01110, partial [Patescibacteria group bacterium]|nr:hypothetical protein [Patescibacteria group bacterium]